MRFNCKFTMELGYNTHDDFHCTCDERVITCNNCEYKSVVYHNHWCAVICQKCEINIQNNTHREEYLTINECYSEECYHIRTGVVTLT